MNPKKKVHPKEKTKIHSRSKHRGRYDFKALLNVCPELKTFVIINKYDDETIDFANPKAVIALNKALLMFHYGISYWDIPENYLCPPIPGRADYIHYAADLLGNSNYGKIPVGKHITCLDIGIGASCIYPIIGVTEYDWSFIGADIDKSSLTSSQQIIDANLSLTGKVELRLQPKTNDIIYGVIGKEEVVDLMICNPPFHSSEEMAKAGTLKKLNNLSD